MRDKKELIKELILKNPKDSSTEIYNKIKGTPLGMRKTNYLKIFRETKNLPEPTVEKREASIPIKHRTVYQKRKIAQRKAKLTPKVSAKLPTIPFEQTKFGKMVKSAQTVFNVSEKKAIVYTRKILKLPRKDYHKLNRFDRDILTQFGY